MPEEINRLLTDQLSDLLFTPSADGDENLIREGINPTKIHRAGNVMIDSLVRLLPIADQRFPVDLTSPYALVTLHRPSNVDDLPWLKELLTTLSEISSRLIVLFPVHPRTRQRITELDLVSARVETGASPVLQSEASSHRSQFEWISDRIRLLDPLPHLEFIALQRRAALVITDSGGIQEETTFLGVPCLTVRENTERPITVKLGTNELVGRDLVKLRSAVEKIMNGRSKQGDSRKLDDLRVPLWDGHAAERIARIILTRRSG
jgi:UDP-N-acetylglucosamine 2-epimerase (non-hydrolysing)